MNQNTKILDKGEVFKDKFKVTFFLKKGFYAETYRIKNQQGKTKLLKLFDYSKLDTTQFDNDGNILEIKILKSIKHPNLLNYNESGDVIIQNKKYAYAILDFISGETLADKLKRENTINLYETKDIILGVLNGLKYLHALENPIIHNEITNLNVMIDLSGKVSVPVIIDFGYARYLSQANKDFLKEGLNPLYQANETFNKVFSVQSDIFSVGVLYYHLLEGLPPWFIEISKYKSSPQKLEDALISERNKPLKFISTSDKKTKKIILKALNPTPENRFKTIEQFIKAINEELEVKTLDTPKSYHVPKPKKIIKGEGFSAIAGMQQLKNMIQVDVINALNEKERYAEYGLTIPNGMLLYGPPGCGKTFFAERMAEEIGFNFYQLKPSDVQSKYVNESQEKVKEIFNEAKANSPSVIFIDELDAVVPNRDNANINHMNSSLVNEFFSTNE